MENNIINVEARTCEIVVSEIKATIASVNQSALLGAITVGKDLQELKELVPYGEWGGYIEEHLHFSERKAQQFMQLSDHYGNEDSEFFKAISKPHICADLSFSNALRLLALPEEEVEAFVETHDITSMKVTELEEEIKNLKEHTIGVEDESAYKELSKLRSEKEELLNRITEMENNIAELENSQSEEEITEQELKAKLAEIEVLAEALEKKKASEVKLKEKLQAAEESSKQAIEAAKAEAIEEAKAEAEKAVETKLEDMQKVIDAAMDRASKAETKLQAMNNEDFAVFKVKVTILQETFNDIINAIENIKQSDSEQAAKLMEAFGKVMAALMYRAV